MILFFVSALAMDRSVCAGSSGNQQSTESEKEPTSIIQPQPMVTVTPPPSSSTTFTLGDYTGSVHAY